MKQPNTVEECLNIIQRIKENRWCERYIPQLEKVERYVRGEITSSELLESSGDQQADNLMKGIVFRVLNKAINYQEKDIHYYVELPQDMFFNRLNAPCILAGKVKDIEITYNAMETVGPKRQKEGWPSFHDNHYIEITGDFSSIPEGTMLYDSDWFKIIAKYPNIHGRMYELEKSEYVPSHRGSTKAITFLDSISKTDSEIERYTSPDYNEDNHYYLGKEDAQHLPQEVIDSIEFEIPETYLPGGLVKSGEFGTFKDILDGKYIRREQSERTIIDVLKNRFRGISAIDKREMAFLESEKELILASLRNERAKLLGHYNYFEQTESEKWDQEARRHGYKSFREKIGLPEIEISEENQARIDEITRQIEEIEKNWEERTDG